MDKAKKKLGVTPSHAGQPWGRKHSALDRDQLGRVRRGGAAPSARARSDIGAGEAFHRVGGAERRETLCTCFAEVLRFGKPEPNFFFSVKTLCKYGLGPKLC